MGAGLASTDSSSSQMYRRGVLIHCPSEFSVDIVPPMKEGSSWHYGLRVKPLPNLSMSPPVATWDVNQKRVKGYEIHRKWEDCLDLQRTLEKEYSVVVKVRKGKGGKKGPPVYGNLQRAASFDSLPTGPDPKTIQTTFMHSERASVAPSIRRLSIAPSDAPPLPTNIAQDRSTSPYTSSPLAQTSYESTPIALDIQEQPRPSNETTYGDLATALDTFPMPPTPQDGPVRCGSGYIIRNAQFFSAPVSPLPSVPGSVVPSDCEYESDVQQGETQVRASAKGDIAFNVEWIHITCPFNALVGVSQIFSNIGLEYGLSQSLIQALAMSETSEEPASTDDQSEIEKMRKMSLSSLSSSSSRRLPPPIPPRSSLRRPSASHMRHQSDATTIAKPSIPGEASPTVVYDEEEPDFEIVTHTVLNSYLEDARLSLLSSECAISSNSGSSIRRSMTPSIASAYSTSSAGGRDSISGHGIPPPVAPSPTTPLPPAVCPIGDSIVLCRVSRTAPLSTVREMLASKFRQAAGVQLDLLKHGFVLGYVNQRQWQQQQQHSSTCFGPVRRVVDRVQQGTGSASLPRSSGRPGTAPSGGRTRSSSLSSVAACADPMHLSLIVTQRDWENAVMKHGEKMTVRVLLAGVD
ncbi:hypothetical protein RHS01_06370 [Rhizoctonia solani]|uniref:Uncharacterized protein n=1 Tax=Rhizoctonia solani TaxID=456999 RepID=A0A8H7M406_9AGAM|nr:hypothetical protein RHS01_06370 [Rhizoctonia solani]